jgi:hypothetical protein
MSKKLICPNTNRDERLDAVEAEVDGVLFFREQSKTISVSFACLSLWRFSQLGN